MNPSKATQSRTQAPKGTNQFRSRAAANKLGQCYNAAVTFIEKHTKYGVSYNKKTMFSHIQSAVGYTPSTYLAETVRLLVERHIITATPRGFKRYSLPEPKATATPAIMLPPHSGTGRPGEPLLLLPKDTPATRAQVEDLGKDIGSLRALIVALAIDVQRLIEETRKR